MDSIFQQVEISRILELLKELIPKFGLLIGGQKTQFSNKLTHVFAGNGLNSHEEPDT